MRPPLRARSFNRFWSGRDFSDRAGLVVTSAYSLGALAEKLGEDTIPSRLAGMCQVLEIQGFDHRLSSHYSGGSQDHGDAGG